MKKKLLALVLCTCIALSACGQNDEVDTLVSEASEETEESEDTPAPEDVCNESGHEWIEATCTEPRCCSRCGLTEGEALGHTPTEADYWTPSVCEVCGEELAPALTPEFVSRGFESMEEGKTYTYKSEYIDDYGNTTQIHGNVTVDYDVVDSLKIWRGSSYNRDSFWELEAREGYSWRLVNITFEFKHVIGASDSVHLDDMYYSIPEIHIPYYDEEDELGIDSGTVLLDDGKEYDIIIISDKGNSGWYNPTIDGGDIKIEIAFALSLPVDYDGFVIMLYDSKYRRLDPDYVCDDKFFSNALFFHCD